MQEYQEQVPITAYEGLGNAIEAIAQGERNVLTADVVKLFQPTGGSTNATKLIPWTSTMGREFRRGIAPWIASLYRRKPALLRGTAYWSLSLPTTPLRSHGQLRVGFDHDAEYLGFVGQKLFEVVSAVSPDIVLCQNMAEFKLQTLVSLMADENLSLISVWSPTFLTMLIEEFTARQDEVIESLRCSGRAGAAKRADFLSSIAREGPISLFNQAWPNLQLISCWTHGPSALYSEKIRQFFPSVEIQGKGLVATEAFVSLPFHEDMDPVLAAASHFFEFQDPVSNKISLAHEVIREMTYRVIVTTGGGLYRYPLGDLVKVTGFIGTAPCLRFMGREGNISDLFGEKLNGIFVEELVRRLLTQHGASASFFLLAPVIDATGKTGYTLFLQTEVSFNFSRLQSDLERGLAENFHYAHCRRLGQLQESHIYLIDGRTLPAETVFQKQISFRGRKLGDIKMAAIDNQAGWERHFQGRFLV